MDCKSPLSPLFFNLGTNENSKSFERSKRRSRNDPSGRDFKC